MKRVIITAVMLLTILVSVQAQKKRGRMSEADQEQRIEQLAEDLMLDDLQKYSFKSIMKQSMNERSNLRQAGLTNDEMRDRLKEIRASENEQMKKILDQNQFDQFVEYKKNLRDQRRTKARDADKRKE